MVLYCIVFIHILEFNTDEGLYRPRIGVYRSYNSTISLFRLLLFPVTLLGSLVSFCLAKLFAWISFSESALWDQFLWARRIN